MTSGSRDHSSQRIEHGDLDRSFNGMMATLETCDWAMLQLFDELSLRHYRSDNWMAMLRFKLRLRMHEDPLPDNLQGLLEADKELARRLFRVDRALVLQRFARSGIALPSTCANWLSILNQVSVKDSRILALVPASVAERLAQV